MRNKPLTSIAADFISPSLNPAREVASAVGLPLRTAEAAMGRMEPFNLPLSNLHVDRDSNPF